MDGPALSDVEAELGRLPDVTGVRIVGDGGTPTEVHVLARPGKPAKQIVRDVQSVALARFGLNLDRRIVSVVQLESAVIDAGAGADPMAAAPRPVISGITAEASGLRTLVRVTLAVHDAEAVGFAEGSIASMARHRLVASATLDALRQLLPAAECLDVDSAQIVRIGVNDVAVVTVVAVVPPDEQVISGSAIVRLHQEQEAVARALLDATNRRLPRLG
ncbi:MAG TPA: hypothetical protein VI916_05235 [Acidimicrobiia bacterium]|nr:hypothetical protein [Acidimicrobiia bacterium]